MHVNSCSMHGDHRLLCNVNKTGSNTLRLWRATGIGSIEEYTSNKTVLDTFSNRRPKTGSRNSKKNTDQRKVRQTADRSNSTSPFMNVRDGTKEKCHLILEMS